METLVDLSIGNGSAFTFIQEDQHRPGVLITFLSHAIVEFNINNPKTLILVAGIPNEGGYGNGAGSSIRFRDPWDMVQINRNSWILSDSSNNCLRNFNYQVNANRNLGDATTDWSKSCNSLHSSSNIGDKVPDTVFYRPRGLTYLPDKSKIYITYERPYSLAEIILSSNRRLIVKYSSQKYQLRRVIPFDSELVISTDPNWLLLSYRETKLGYIIDKSIWQQNINRNINSSLPFSAGIAYLGEDVFIETISGAHSLALVDQSQRIVAQICTGSQGQLNSDLTSCRLDSPHYITYINSTLYIGESGMSGGGIRTIAIKGDTGEIPLCILSFKCLYK